MDRKTCLWMNLMDFAKCTGCHQKPERSFFYKDWQFPVCARCTGVLIGQITAYIAFLKKKKPIKTSLIFCVAMFTDWLVQHLKIKESTNIRRIITGILGGFGFSIIYLSAFKKAISSFTAEK